jgi:transcriptional regulator with PAS, ATPase and Fis domain
MTTTTLPVLIGSSAAARALDGDITAAARSDAKVLITGESGVGKEIAARLIHTRGARRTHPLFAMNCAGLPDSLLESELFGHVRGSFTGAYRDKPGMLQAADEGTLFMDEVGEMSLRMQAALLRFLETGEVQRVGADAVSAPVNVRIICATNRNLRERIASGEFREDLYYRLNVIHVHIPPLRERREDIRELLQAYLRHYAARHQTMLPQVSQEALDLLMAYDWPGNVRELKNVIERLIVRATQGEVTIDDLPVEIRCVMPPINAMSAGADAPPAPGSAEIEARRLFNAMVRDGASFWTTVYEPFHTHDLTRETLRLIVTYGLEQVRGRYSALTELFNMDRGDYKRFLNVLRKHECLVPFHAFRSAPSSTVSRETAAPADTTRENWVL